MPRFKTKPGTGVYDKISNWLSNTISHVDLLSTYVDNEDKEILEDIQEDLKDIKEDLKDIKNRQLN